MDRQRCSTLLARLVAIGSLMVMSATGCATEPKPMRPLPPGIRFDATGLEYIYPIPPAKTYEALLHVLQSTLPVVFSEKENKEKLIQHALYGEVITKFLNYEENGKKYRKKCNASVHVIPDYKMYSKVSISCEYDVYELGLIHGRGGIHNLFTQWWDWYPENRVYVAEDMFELIQQKLGLKQDEVILLPTYSLTELPAVIQEYEAKKKQK